MSPRQVRCAVLVSRTCCCPCCDVSAAEADELRVQWGKNELEEKSKPKWLVFVELVCTCLARLMLNSQHVSSFIMGAAHPVSSNALKLQAWQRYICTDSVLIGTRFLQ